MQIPLFVPGVFGWRWKSALCWNRVLYIGHWQPATRLTAAPFIWGQMCLKGGLVLGFTDGLSTGMNLRQKTSVEKKSTLREIGGSCPLQGRRPKMQARHDGFNEAVHSPTSGPGWRSSWRGRASVGYEQVTWRTVLHPGSHCYALLTPVLVFQVCQSERIDGLVKIKSTPVLVFVF